MLTLASKLKRDDGVKGPRASNPASDSNRRVSVRDKLLVKEVAELEVNLPCTCEVNFPDPNKLHYFHLTVNPDEGYYQNGTFQFEIEVPDAYNMVMKSCNSQGKTILYGVHFIKRSLEINSVISRTGKEFGFGTIMVINIPVYVNCPLDFEGGI
ncbi:hypothetical protein lerEdw1_004380 [Lerista edwardsae]|nr:hypothetical protein lerEdw1_004380 [Lerista edwardsae]